MTKEEKAKEIVFRLAGTSASWITYDATLRGHIGFKIEGIDEIVKVPSYLTVAQGEDEIAYAVVGAGLNHGYCKNRVEVLRKSARSYQEYAHKLRQELDEVISETIQRKIERSLKNSQGC